VGHLEVKQVGGLELRRDPPDQLQGDGAVELGVSDQAGNQGAIDAVAGTAGGMTGGPPQYLRISAARCAREALAGFDAGKPLVFPGRACAARPLRRSAGHEPHPPPGAGRLTRIG